MPRLVVALIASSALFAAALGAAAQLPVDGGTIQAGSDATRVCDPDGVTVTYRLQFDVANVAIKIRAVAIKGIHPSCGGSTVVAVLTRGGAAAAITNSATVPTGAAGDVTLELTAPVPPLASDVENVHVVIYSGP